MKTNNVSEMTNVAGYYNPNTWRVQLAVSELNLHLTLAPNEFVRDRATGQKVNDPVLEMYIGPKMLQREIVKDTVPILRLAPLPVRVPADARSHPVIEGSRGPDGKWQPVPARQPATATMMAPPASQSSVQAMSIEEAKKRGFIGKQRLVPEDYGAPEVGTGASPGIRIPRIKHSFETTPPMAKPGALPAAYLQEAVNDPEHPNLAHQVNNIVDSMHKAAQIDPERDDVSIAQLVNAQLTPAAPVTPLTAPVTASLPVVAPPAATPPPAPPTARPVTAPVSAKARVAAPLPPATEPALPEPVLESAPPVTGPKSATPANQRFLCPVPGCGNQTSKYRAHLKKHILRKHPELADQLLPQLGNIEPVMLTDDPES